MGTITTRERKILTLFSETITMTHQQNLSQPPDEGQPLLVPQHYTPLYCAETLVALFFSFYSVFTHSFLDAGFHKWVATEIDSIRCRKKFPPGSWSTGNYYNFPFFYHFSTYVRTRTPQDRTNHHNSGFCSHTSSHHGEVTSELG
jgi:hypothetical protein